MKYICWIWKGAIKFIDWVRTLQRQNRSISLLQLFAKRV